jgi:hypothetical protein
VLNYGKLKAASNELKMNRRFLWALLPILLVLCAPPAQAQASSKKFSFEKKAVQAFMLYCLPPLKEGLPADGEAKKQKLPELSRSNEEAFLNGKPGRVFAIPSVGKGVFLAAQRVPVCSVLIEKVNPDEFILQVEYWFDPANTPFRMQENGQLPNGDHFRRYIAQIGGSMIDMMVNYRMKPFPGGMQAMLTANRLGH